MHGLYAIADRALISAGQLAGQVELALQGGAALLQYRAKEISAAQREQEARMLFNLCLNYRIPFIINDDLALAKTLGADGVHLGVEDAAAAYARQALGPRAIIGVSCYNSLERALQAQREGADYIAFGRFFPSRSKPDAVQAGIELLREARKKLHLPIAAIGGITLQNAAQLLEAGADMLAVIHGVFGEQDVRAAAQSYTTLFRRKKNEPVT
ncbi:MAG: thiamine phosphate synthase [Gammaproteobacteria bacterium]|nr:thiamine phosphate synthase [Gammaproteobacteria bacterium]